MRLWSIHPKYLDPIGLVALWREGLLAKKVLEGKTRGYRNHPELDRFKSVSDPLLAINSYLYYVYLEAAKRGYHFNLEKINSGRVVARAIPIPSEQVAFEFSHLCKKLMKRNRRYYVLACKNSETGVELNPLFYCESDK